MRSAIPFGFTWIAVLCLLEFNSTGHAVEHVVFRPRPDSDRELSVKGEVLVTATDGGFLLRADDGQLWTVQPERLISRTSDDEPLVPISREEAGKRLLGQLPAGFQVHQTAHYVICHNTTDEYVEWVGSLFEQAYTGF